MEYDEQERHLYKTDVYLLELLCRTQQILSERQAVLIRGLGLGFVELS